MITREDIEHLSCAYCGSDRTGKGSLIQNGRVFCNETCLNKSNEFMMSIKVSSEELDEAIGVIDEIMHVCKIEKIVLTPTLDGGLFNTHILCKEREFFDWDDIYSFYLTVLEDKYNPKNKGE